MKKSIASQLLLSLLTVMLFATCGEIVPDKEALTQSPDDESMMMTGVTTKPANKFNNMFNRYGNGWTGGDATYSVKLPDGRTVWMFGDSFLDTVYADNTRPLTSPLIRNCFMVQNGTNMTTLCGNNIDDPEALVNTADPINEWYWPGDGTVIGDTLYVFMMYFVRTGGGGFDFAYQRTDLVTFSLPTITEVNRTTVFTNEDIMWGADILEDGSYIYVYGPESFTFTKYPHVMRFPAGNIRGTKEFWNGTTWVTTEPATTVGRMKRTNGLNIDVSAQFAVFYSGGKYRMVTQDVLFGPNIYSWEASNPNGPWKIKQTVYTTPETGGDIWTYNAWVHPQFTTADGYILLSYNKNSLNFLDLFGDATIYRPQFVYFKYL
ncbi:MAG TPA: DUF5005 domain-containing protein [Chitinophagales bacterium]|nr:DUF5005 domain-containing protein [Chitinophagales bacterium]